MDVKSLSDEDLASMLMERGFNPGPIVDTTRKVYQKKLQRMLKENVHLEGPTEEEEEEYSEVEEEDDIPDTVPIDDVVPPYSYATRSSPSRTPQLQTTKVFSSSYTSATTGGSSYLGGDSTLTRRPLRETSSFDPSHLVSQAKPEPATAQKAGGLSLCAKLVFLLIVGVIVFLVIQHMEPPASDPLADVVDE